MTIDDALDRQGAALTVGRQPQEIAVVTDQHPIEHGGAFEQPIVREPVTPILQSGQHVELTLAEQPRYGATYVVV